MRDAYLVVLGMMLAAGPLAAPQVRAQDAPETVAAEAPPRIC